MFAQVKPMYCKHVPSPQTAVSMVWIAHPLMKASGSLLVFMLHVSQPWTSQGAFTEDWHSCTQFGDTCTPILSRHVLKKTSYFIQTAEEIRFGLHFGLDLSWSEFSERSVSSLKQCFLRCEGQGFLWVKSFPGPSGQLRGGIDLDKLLNAKHAS